MRWTRRWLKFLDLQGPCCQEISKLKVTGLKSPSSSMDLPHTLLTFSVPNCLNWLWGTPSLLFNGYQGSFLGVKWPRRKVDHAPSCSAYSPYMPSWCGQGQFFPPSSILLSPSSLTFSFTLLPSDQHQHSWIIACSARSRLWFRVQICCRYLLLTIVLIITLVITIVIITLPLSPCIFLKLLLWSVEVLQQLFNICLRKQV